MLMTLTDIKPSAAPAHDSTIECKSLLVQGDAEVLGTLTAQRVVERSDQRCKEDIEPLQIDCLDRVNKLRAVTYKLVGCLEKQQSIGFLAQDVRDILPQAVVADVDTGLLGVSPYTLVVLALQAIQQLSGSVTGHTAQINDILLGMQASQLAAAKSAQLDRNATDTEAEVDAACDSQTGTSAADCTASNSSSEASTDTQSPSSESDFASSQIRPFHGLTEVTTVTKYLLRGLQQQETDPNLGAKFGKAIGICGVAAMWDCYQAACSGPVGKRFRKFMLVMEQKKKEVRARYADCQCRTLIP